MLDYNHRPKPGEQITALINAALVYRSRKAKQSQDAWGLGNAIFGRTLMAGSVNVAVISVAFLAVIVWKTEISGWTVALWLILPD